MQIPENIEAVLIFRDYQHHACQHLQDVDFARKQSFLGGWEFVTWKVSRQLDEQASTPLGALETEDRCGGPVRALPAVAHMQDRV